jgi:hypothetical protein
MSTPEELSKWAEGLVQIAQEIDLEVLTKCIDFTTFEGQQLMTQIPKLTGYASSAEQFVQETKDDAQESRSATGS